MQATPSAATPAANRPPATPRRRKSRRGLFLVIATLVVAALVAAAVIHGKRGNKALRVTVEKAVVKNITQIVMATGKIQPEVEVKIAPEVSGEVIAMPFREGATVKKGDIIARIKPDIYQFLVEQQQAHLAAAGANALAAQVAFGKAREDFQRAEGLHKTGLIADSDFTAAKAAYDSAKATLDSARASIHSADGMLNQAKDQLGKTTVYAPMDGTISSRTSEVGERVVGTAQFAGTEMMRVADLTNMEVRVNINENDIVNVKVGDKTRITIDAFPGRKFEGVVREIGATAQTTGFNTQDEVTNFQVRIRILDKTAPRRPGMSANVDVETQSVENVIAVPIQSVTVRSREGSKTIEQLATDREKKAAEVKGEGAATAVNTRNQRQAERADRDSLNRVVFILDGGKVKMVSVETGIADSTHMEIKSGVSEGEQVVAGSFAAITRTLTEGMEVQIEQPRKTGPSAEKK
jgi:HlyD family secretion protein